MNPVHNLSFAIKLVLSIWYLQRKAYNHLLWLKKKFLHQEHTVLGFEKMFKIKIILLCLTLFQDLSNFFSFTAFYF